MPKPKPKLTEHVTPVCPCPWCGHQTDRATLVDPRKSGEPPERGDFTVCINCGSVSRFDGLLLLVRASEKEWQEQPEPLPRIVRAARRAIVQRNSRKRNENPKAD